MDDAGKVRCLTGLRPDQVARIEAVLDRTMRRSGRGRPPAQLVRVMVLVVLMKLRSDLPFRTLSVMTGIPSSTLHRWFTRLVRTLAVSFGKERRREAPAGLLVVDTTMVRVRSTASADWSGYRNRRCRKIQMLVGIDGAGLRRLVSVSGDHPGSVHDKVIWDREFDAIRPYLDRPVLADKAYAGARAEGDRLFRPVKRNEKRWRDDPLHAKDYNSILGRWRVLVEHAFARMKTFRILQGMFSLRVDKLAATFRAIAMIVNIMLER
jgi:hypothetical protein